MIIIGFHEIKYEPNFVGKIKRFGFDEFGITLEIEDEKKTMRSFHLLFANGVMLSENDLKSIFIKGDTISVVKGMHKLQE